MLTRLILLSLACTVAGGYLYKVDHDLAWVPIVTAVVFLVSACLAVAKCVRNRHEMSASELASEEDRVVELHRNKTLV